jgi:hypothetical protein
LARRDAEALLFGATLDDGAIERRQRMTARTTLAMTRRQEAHGTVAGAQVPG